MKDEPWLLSEYRRQRELIDKYRALLDPDNAESVRLVRDVISQSSRDTYGHYLAQIKEDSRVWARNVLTELTALVNDD